MGGLSAFFSTKFLGEGGRKGGKEGECFGWRAEKER